MVSGTFPALLLGVLLTGVNLGLSTGKACYQASEFGPCLCVMQKLPFQAFRSKLFLIDLNLHLHELGDWGYGWQPVCDFTGFDAQPVCCPQNYNCLGSYITF